MDALQCGLLLSLVFILFIVLCDLSRKAELQALLCRQPCLFVHHVLDLTFRERRNGQIRLDRSGIDLVVVVSDLAELFAVGISGIAHAVMDHHQGKFAHCAGITCTEDNRSCGTCKTIVESMHLRFVALQSTVDCKCLCNFTAIAVDVNVDVIHVETGQGVDDGLCRYITCTLIPLVQDFGAGCDISVNVQICSFRILVMEQLVN